MIRLLLILYLIPLFTLAHCSLCIVGTGFLTIAGYQIGVKKIVIGLLVGGLSVAFGEWLNRLVKKKFFKGQEILVIVLTFLLNYLMVKSFISDYFSFYIPIFKDGTTIMIDKSLLTGILGGILVLIAPYISRWITHKRGKTILFQRIIITLILLIIFSLILQFV